MSDLSREQFEAAVVERMKESGFLEVEIRVECLQRHGDGYQDGSIDSYWRFWQASRKTLVIELPKGVGVLPTGNVHAVELANTVNNTLMECRKAIKAHGLGVKL